MKLTMQRIDQGEDEVIIRYREQDKRIRAIAELIRGMEQKLCGSCGEEKVMFLPEEVLYLESVDGVSFAYLTDKVCRMGESLGELADAFGTRGYFRCSKSMVLNLYRIAALKSEPGSRIRATMENGEQVMISRKYAGKLREILRQG